MEGQVVINGGREERLNALVGSVRLGSFKLKSGARKEFVLVSSFVLLGRTSAILFVYYLGIGVTANDLLIN